MRLREIACEDQDEEVPGCELCVVNLEKKKRIRKIKVKKCMGVGCVAECVEESKEREKKNGMFWNEGGRNSSSPVKKKSIMKSQK